MREAALGVRWSMGRDTFCWICDAPVRCAELDAHVRDCLRIEAKSMGYTVPELQAMLREIHAAEAREEARKAAGLQPPDSGDGGRWAGWGERGRG